MSDYFSSADMTARLHAEARQWQGTPFKAHAGLRGVGCDCIGMAAGVYRALGVRVPSEFPAYSVGAGAHLDASKVQEVVEACGAFARVEPMAIGALLPGDLLGFRLNRVIHHVGIYLGDGLFVHCAQSIGVTKSTFQEPAWRTRLAAAWRPQNV